MRCVLQVHTPSHETSVNALWFLAYVLGLVVVESVIFPTAGNFHDYPIHVSSPRVIVPDAYLSARWSPDRSLNRYRDSYLPGFGRGPLSRFSCAPLTIKELNLIVTSTADFHGISQPVIHAMIMRESGGQPCVRSSKGARGLMQLMPETARSLGVTNLDDPRQSIEAGVKYLKQQLNHFKDLKLALAAYNAGPAKVEQFGGVPPLPETQKYVEAILSGVDDMNRQ